MALDRDKWWSTGRDEPVEVNQRALIDKVLARYSGEFTVFRELLQNSDDAQSSAVEIRFETRECLLRKGSEGIKHPPLLQDFDFASVAQWTFKNNGIAFRDEDWTRLRKIAEGNPDEKKIGAFGVGFYSLFSVTENPFVSSGGHAMQFYWKDNKDQLNVRRGDLPTKGVADPWTTFEMSLRQAAPMPPLLDLLRFLASSVTFMTRLSDVSVYFDEHRIGHIKKSSGMSRDVDIPNTLKRSSKSKIMNVRSVKSHPIEIRVAFQHPPNTSGAVQLTLAVFTAEADAKVDETLSAELLRSTKKRPPVRVKYHLIYTGKDKYDQNLADTENQPAACRGIFRGLHADLDGATHTRMFIGHATAQTTGIGGHMASYFIPTVERECIDFVDRSTAIWNKELLYVGGFLCRLIYDSEISAIENALVSAIGGVPCLQPQQDLHAAFLHILKFFAFHRSTPSPEVGELLRHSFYGCSSTPLRMLSSVGVRNASSIKKYDSSLAEFLKNVPMLSSIVSECESTIPLLRNQEIISPMTFSDIVRNLRQNPLNEKGLVSCLRWWISSGHSVSGANRAQLLGATVFKNVDGRSTSLSSVHYFIGPQSLGDYIPENCPLPISVLPQDVARQFKPEELGNFGWREFPVVDWLCYISQPKVMSNNPGHDFTRSIDWATRVLDVLSRVWRTASDNDRCSVKASLANKICVPTSCGLRAPKNAYFPGTTTDLFRDLELPTVQFSSGFHNTDNVEALLSFIGVRKHVDPRLIVDQMRQTGIWNTQGLIKYLVQVRKSESLTQDEVTGLQSSAIFATVGAQYGANRFRASDLYAPNESLRRLRLPVIEWDENSRWSDDSDEARLLFEFGLHQYPPLEKLIGLCSSKDVEVRTAAFQYLCDNLYVKYSAYDPSKFADIAFVPGENNSGSQLKKLGDIFSGTQWKSLGFTVLQEDYLNAPTKKLGIQQHPPPSMLLSCLEKTPPPDEDTALKWFEILNEQISSFNKDHLACLSKLPIVPTTSSGVRAWLSPTQCYLAKGRQDDFYSKLFVFVDFGPIANRFLTACGSREEPTIAEVANALVGDPKRFYALAGGHEKFLTQLRNLAVNKHRIPGKTIVDMKVVPILLSRKVDSYGRQDHYTDELRSADGIVVADDINASRLFHNAIFVAPEEDLLQDFYLSLGCKRLSTVVQEQCMPLNEMVDMERSSDMRTFVLERLTLFLHECTHVKPNVTVDWLSEGENFKVKICKELSISKTLTIGSTQTTRSIDASAGANRRDGGRIELWLSKSYDEPDMYEISISLCRLLFGTVTVSESLLFTTMLSTDLEALRRRGCNVDQILNKRKLARDALEEESKKTSDDTASEASESAMSSHATEPDIPKSCNSSNLDLPAPGHRTMALRGILESLDPSGFKIPAQGHGPGLGASVGVPKSSGGSTSDLSSKTTLVPPPGVLKGMALGTSELPSTLMEHALQAIQVSSNTTDGSSQTWNQQHVVPLRNILTDTTMAIKPCDPEEGGSLVIKGPTNDCFRGVSGKTKELKLVGEVVVTPHAEKPGVVKFFATPDIPNLDTLIVSKQGSLDRFMNIIMPITRIFSLSVALLNIFYDTEEGSIAFNRDGSLFLNLQHFEVWYDKDVERGVQQSAQISWFLTLAHQMTHNLIKSHNSEQAYWFSALCEANIPALLQVLRPSSS